MRILIISSYLPYPLFSGGHVRLYNLLKHLSTRHQIVFVCEKRDHQTEKDILEVKKFCEEIITVDRKKQWSLNNILKTAFSLYPFLLIGHTNSEMRKKIENLFIKEKFDLIHVETFYVMQNLPKTNLPIVLTEHNIEYLVYKRYANNAAIFLRPFLFLDVLKMKYWEKYFWKNATKVIAVSDEERKIMGKKDVAIVQNGVDKEAFKINSAGWKTKFKETKKILFIGDFKWIQNRTSVEWILKKIWPIISSKFKSEGSISDIKLWIVGRNIPDDIKKLTDDNDVIFDENAPKETSEIFKQADLLLAPIKVGGGTSFKILEAMASGIPVVTTSLGIEGIEAKIGKDVLVSDLEEEMADLVVSVISDEKIYEKISQNARKLIEEKYDWAPIVQKLEGVYKSVLKI
ncbi:glycosyltransferase [Candidatus Microgenomates bacterium]|nr:MAG: glycosyltransferase [Candidatus Microgenomates bacterium]